MDQTELINATAFHKSSTFQVTSAETLIRTSTSWDFNGISFSNDAHSSTTSPQVPLFKNGKAMHNGSSAAFTTIPTTTVTTSRVNQTASNTNTIVVGLTCGLAGLLLGIIISTAFWLYRKNGITKKQTPALEKNPKERTFEPLDLSLTRPAYEQNVELGDYQNQDDQHHHQTCHAYRMPSSCAPRPLKLNKAFETGKHSSNHGNSYDGRHRYYKDAWNDHSLSLDRRVLDQVKQNQNCEVQKIEVSTTKL